MSKGGASDSKNTLYCSFCGKSQHEVRKLIAGPTVFVCDECVELCMDIISAENTSSLVKSRDGIPPPKEITPLHDDYLAASSRPMARNHRRTPSWTVSSTTPTGRRSGVDARYRLRSRTNAWRQGLR
jgi:hypothetical protein